MSVHVFGIRHHGPGSARSLLAAFQHLRPDLVLVEGPVEGTEQIAWISDAGLKPPVALLVYRPDEPLSSVFYPFATFSPEWNALRYAAENHVAARFIDLPKAHWLALPGEMDSMPASREDALQTIAQMAGEEDFERWWERLVENRGDDQVFPAIHEAMAALRADGARLLNRVDALREAAMRQEIRAAQRQGFERIAVVCGAWHAPALSDLPAAKLPAAKEDAAELKGLAKVKVQVTWVPWTHGRLIKGSGYGAGIDSPGWYEHLWQNRDHSVTHWVAKIAQLLRDEDLDASPAQTIDTVRLAETLSTFRGRRSVTLRDLNDATTAVLLFGDTLPLRLIEQKLIVGEAMGEVPEGASAVPIQRDLEAEQKRLRLKAETIPRTLDLDLRKEGDRERSYLLHRLALLGIAWGGLEAVQGKLGTFHEIWRLKWEPEFSIEIIAAARWGNTVGAAASARALQLAADAKQLPDLTDLIEPVLKANLPDAAPPVLDRLREIAAVAPDIAHLMEAIPPLARVSRYGDVRQTDRGAVQHAVNELTARVCVGLPPACGSLSDEAARSMLLHVGSVHHAIGMLDREDLRGPWHDTLRRVADLPGVHGLMGGRCCRLLLDVQAISIDDVALRASQSLTPGVEPAQGAAWIEGFLEKSGSVLLVNEGLWNMVDQWVQELDGEAFHNMLPLLRRTFATFQAGERRQLGERVRDGAGARQGGSLQVGRIDRDRAATVLPLLKKILGIEIPGEQETPHED